MVTVGGVDFIYHLVQSGHDTRTAGAGRRISCPAGRQEVRQLLGERLWNSGETTGMHPIQEQVRFFAVLKGHLAGQHLPNEDAQAVYVHVVVVRLSIGNLTQTDTDTDRSFYLQTQGLR